MCGIIGLHLKTPRHEHELGALATAMLSEMTDRGRDSSGIAIYSEGRPGAFKYSLRAPQGSYDWTPLLQACRSIGDTSITTYPQDAVLTVGGPDRPVLSLIDDDFAELKIVAWGESLEVFKDTGTPAEISHRYEIAARTGHRAIGHTRMATESAVTTDHSHPFSPAADLCLVHNGSFSNYFSIRRDLEQQGARFVTDNDSEVAARLIGMELEGGADLGDAIRSMMKQLDGFYTLLVSTANQFAVVRDAFVCKPAMVAETADFVAMSSEYRALALLPGIEGAEVFEPQGEEVFVWSR